MKILKFLLLMAACIGLPAIASNIVKEKISIGDGIRISMESKILNESRSLLVYLPDNYAKSDKAYPVVYVLDGDRHFNHAIIASQLLQEQERIPELIIVAIPNNDTRSRDLYFKKENFTQFIKDEVIATIDKNYRTTGLNTLVGHSLAGYFTVDLLANYPELFKNYIAASPVLQGKQAAIFEQMLVSSDTKSTKQKSLFFTLTSQGEEGKRVTEWLDNFVNLLTEKPPKKLDWRYEFLANQTHMTTYYLTFFNGMTHVFNNYQSPSFSNPKEYMDFGGIQGLGVHYEKRAAIYGTDKAIPEDTLLNVANMLLSEGQFDAALNHYQTIINDYPQSARSFSGLGQVYSSLKQYDKSITAHQKAVKLGKLHSPEWQQKRFKSKLDKVKKESEILNQK